MGIKCHNYWEYTPDMITVNELLEAEARLGHIFSLTWNHNWRDTGNL